MSKTNSNEVSMSKSETAAAPVELKMRVAVMNLTGNAGKTMITRQVIRPNLPGSRYFSVETVNKDGSEEQLFSEEEMLTLIQEMVMVESCVIDVGASVAAAFFSAMNLYYGTISGMIDRFVIPVTADYKHVSGGLGAAAMLMSEGVPPEKIRFVFNQTKQNATHEQLSATFDGVIRFCADNGIPCSLDARIGDNAAIKGVGKSKDVLLEIAADPRNYQAEILSTQDASEKNRLAALFTKRVMAQTVTPQLGKVWNAIVS